MRKREEKMKNENYPLRLASFQPLRTTGRISERSWVGLADGIGGRSAIGVWMVKGNWAWTWVWGEGEVNRGKGGSWVVTSNFGTAWRGEGGCCCCC